MTDGITGKSWYLKVAGPENRIADQTKVAVRIPMFHTAHLTNRRFWLAQIRATIFLYFVAAAAQRLQVIPTLVSKVPIGNVVDIEVLVESDLSQPARYPALGARTVAGEKLIPALLPLGGRDVLAVLSFRHNPSSGHTLPVS